MSRKKCPECGAPMNNDYEAFWNCDNCGELVAKPGYSFDPDEDEDELPEACAACGGSYPQCTTSCKLFDD